MPGLALGSTMRIGFLIGDLDRERPRHTTIYLAREAANLGHEVTLVPYDGISCGRSNRPTARAFRPGPATHASPGGFLDDVQSPGRPVARADLHELELLLLRHEPYEDPALPSWGPLVAITLGRPLSDSGFVEIGRDDPAPAAPDEAGSLRRAAIRALDALGLGWGPAHLEFRLASDGPRPIEVNPRLAGGYLPELVRVSYAG